MKNRSQRFVPAAPAAAVILGVAMLVIAGGAAFASPPSAPEKLARQIDVMSRIVDKVLLDSPNFLVHAGDNVTGFYLPDYGAVFAFEASLTDEYFDGNAFSWWPGGVEFRKEDGNKTIVIKRKHSSHDKGKGDDDDEAQAKDPAKLYDLGKEELVQMLLDYAETLSGLPSGQSVVIVANVKNDRLWKDHKGHQQLDIRVSGDDLKAFANDRLSESDLKSRMKIEEY